MFCVSNAELGIIIIGLFSGNYFNPGCNGVSQYLCSQKCGEPNFRIAYSLVFELVTTHTLIYFFKGLRKVEKKLEYRSDQRAYKTPF